jgi:hypothetical protein
MYRNYEKDTAALFQPTTNNKPLQKRDSVRVNSPSPSNHFLGKTPHLGRNIDLSK